MRFWDPGDVSLPPTSVSKSSATCISTASCEAMDVQVGRRAVPCHMGFTMWFLLICAVFEGSIDCIEPVNHVWHQRD